MAKKKYYVVWNGRINGIFETWAECQKQINGFPGAKFMSFENKAAAEEAFKNKYDDYYGTNKKTVPILTEEEIKKYGRPILDSMVVDAACSSKTGLVEYKGIFLKTNEEIFSKGPYNDGTNNIGEFLAIVHALAYLKQKNSPIPVYSDSLYAINWVRDKEARTNHPRSSKNKKLFELIDRALIWLKQNRYPNKVLKWETKAWGENPADFGRK
jgi:ribonuclease HI